MVKMFTGICKVCFETPFFLGTEEGIKKYRCGPFFIYDHREDSGIGDQSVLKTDCTVRIEDNFLRLDLYDTTCSSEAKLEVIVRTLKIRDEFYISSFENYAIYEYSKDHHSFFLFCRILSFNLSVLIAMIICNFLLPI